MLQSLSIKNYALIESLELDFQDGFSVITGETGAGKSILLGAIGLLAGNRADSSSIRDGAAKCTIEGAFGIQDYSLRSFFDENDLEYDDECIIRRELLSSGKSRAFINDSPASLAQLKALGNRLIDIHSQHQNLLLNTESFQLEVLDTLAQNEKEREAWSTSYHAYRKAAEALRKAEDEQAKSHEDEDFIRFQLSQLTDAKLKADEQEALEEELSLLEHAEEIKSDILQVTYQLNNEEDSHLNALKNCTNILHGLIANYPSAEEWANRMNSVYIEMKDIVDEMEDASERISFDPDRLAEVQERLNLIYSLEQKHHVQDVNALLTIEKDLTDRLSLIDNSEEHIAALKESLETCHKEMIAAGKALTATRKKSAKVVETGIVERLVNLGMPNIRFQVSIDGRETPAADGMDTVSFLFSANKSSALQNISDVASGGEISRVMLAIKAMIATARQLPTIIFDEIDTGISGNIADRMGAIMREMGSQGRQIISITHLPQIAAKGVAHFKVSKSETVSGTVTAITRLNDEERLREVAAMMSGATLTEAALNNARELLSQT